MTLISLLTDLYRVVRLVCSFSKKLKKATLYKDEYFMKIGTKTELLKVRGLATFDRLGNAKLKRSKKTIGAHSKSKTKTSGVKEKGKSQNHIDNNTIRHLPLTTAHQITCLNDKCNVVISLVMSYTTNDWYLSSKCCLDHRICLKTCHI